MASHSGSIGAGSSVARYVGRRHLPRFRTFEQGWGNGSGPGTWSPDRTEVTTAADGHQRVEAACRTCGRPVRIRMDRLGAELRDMWAPGPQSGDLSPKGGGQAKSQDHLDIGDPGAVRQRHPSRRRWPVWISGGSEGRRAGGFLSLRGDRPAHRTHHHTEQEKRTTRCSESLTPTYPPRPPSTWSTW
jgi:hypothetical protein